MRFKHLMPSWRYAELTCAFVDGVAAAPGCPDSEADNASHVLIHQMAKVAAGDHTIEVKLNALNAKGQITGWETDYTIYERKVNGAD
jgi:hypothetical protein